MKAERQGRGEVIVRVKGKNLTITPALHDQVVRKMQRLDKYHDQLHEIDIELWTESTRDSDQRNHVEATTLVLGRIIRVCTDHGEMHAAIDDAVDKLYRQLNRQKERLKSHHGAKLGEVESTETDLLKPVTADPDNDLPIVPERPEIVPKQLDLEPMFEDDAAQELAEQGFNFLVFLNARNEKLNVLYRRNDGNYGLIEPRIR